MWDNSAENLSGLMLKNRQYWGKIWFSFKAGDTDAFEEIYKEFSDALFSYGSKITKDRDLLKDSIQDLFIDLYRYDLNLRRPEYLEYYLIKSLKNKLIRAIKRQRMLEFVPDDHLALFDLKLNFEDEFYRQENDQKHIETLKIILKNLDPSKRELLFLKFNTGLNNTEIGDILQLKPETVKKQLYRLLQTLHDNYGTKLMELFVICFKA